MATGQGALAFMFKGISAANTCSGGVRYCVVSIHGLTYGGRGMEDVLLPQGVLEVAPRGLRNHGNKLISRMTEASCLSLVGRGFLCR